MSYTINLFKKTSQYHGLYSAAHAVSISLINKFIEFRILRCAILTELNFFPSAIDTHLHLSILNKDQIQSTMSNGFNDLNPEFIQSALLNNDTCIAVFDDLNKIIAYSWYSHHDTQSDVENMNFSFDPSFVYTFKVFTDEQFRGKRLHAHQMRLALDSFQAQGFKGILCYIYSDNFDSLKSSLRMGYKNAGSILIIKLFGRYFVYYSPNCKKYNIKLKPIKRD